MANPTQPISFTRIIAGIADYDKESVQVDSVAFLRQVDYRTNPRRWTLLPKTVKESGTQITDLPLWGDRVSTDTYLNGDAGNLYKRTSAGSVTLIRAVSGSHGNGLKYFGEDDFLYYPTDISIGRYGRMSDASPTFVDDFLTAEGGVPTNTYSLDLEAGSSHYATAADSASLSITGDLSIEANFKPETLPDAGNEMVLAAKWNKNGNIRSYKFSVYGVSGYFGDGSDGALTISSDTTEAPIDSACSGTSGTNTLTATNANFAAGQIVLIHQAYGTGHGTWQRNKIASYTAGTITLDNTLNYSYHDKAQVRVLKQYTDVTINSTKTYTCKAWNGIVGGILAFVANGTVTVTGTIYAAGKGFRGGQADSSDGTIGFCGEGTGGGTTRQWQRNGNGGGGGDQVTGGTRYGGGGAGGGHANYGSNGDPGYGSTSGVVDAAEGGESVGSADLTSMEMGGGGGGGSSQGGASGAGGNGGGIVFIACTTLTISGLIIADGLAGSNGSDWAGAGGGGSGGSILLKAQVATLGTGIVSASNGTGGSGSNHDYSDGGAGSTGRVHLDYLTSYTGTTTPTLNATQDNSLVINTTYQLRLALSSNGTAEEFLTKNLTSISTGVWGHYAVSWDASDHEAEFFENGISLGSSSGVATSLNDNASLFSIGASFDSSGNPEGFADGKIDDVRVWGSERTVTQIKNNKEIELVGTESGLKGYWQLDNSTSDTAATPDADNLTLVNSPTYSTDVPFSSPTTRLDIDQEDTSTGSTYALGTAIDEGAAHRQTFVPAKDPQKSIGVYISAVGTSADWTLTVHDALNRTVTSKTIANASLNTGHMEFIFASVWTPVVGASYHFHLTATNTTGAPAVVSGSSNNLETGEFKSYYQFLVEDIYHPIEQTLNFLSVGNGRYVAKLEAGNTYDPHRLTFPAGWRVRCIAKWREYFAYGCWKGDSVSDYDQGIIFFWDGYSTTYNWFVEVPEGAINAMLGTQGTLYIIAGYQGDVLEYTGGDKAIKVKRLPKMVDSKYVEVLPGAMTMWRTLVQIGAGVTDSTDFEQGVYSWGKRNNVYLDSLSFDYKISTGNTQSTGIKIGMVLPVYKKLLIGWKDGTGYGLDSVDPAGAVYSDGSIEWLIRDEGGIWKEKKPDVIRADFEKLASGHSIGLQYKLDRATNWTTEEIEDTVDERKLRLQPEFARHLELQVRLNLHTTVATSPAALGLSIAENVLAGEEGI